MSNAALSTGKIARWFRRAPWEAGAMHARPAVKLTKLAKKFQAQISIRASDAAEWINAKSVAKVMALRAARDSIIEIKASGEDAEGAVAALVDLVAADFPDNAS